MAKNKREKFELDIRPSVEFLGLDKVIDQIGEKRVLDHIGKKRVLERLDVDDILANLSPAKRRELQRRLQAEESSAH